MGQISSHGKNAFGQSGRLQELDALRGLAALSVVLFHYTYNQPHINSDFTFRYGITGVDLFFMISGFTISLSLNKISHWKSFVVYRFGRLYPAFWMCVLITSAFVLIYDFQHFKLSDILVNMTMVPAYFGVEDLDGSYWTLAVELIFYLWILCVYMTGKIKDIELSGMLTLMVILAFHFFRPFYPSLYTLVVTKIQLINHFPLFFSGILFYQFSCRGFSIENLLLMGISIFASFYLHDKGGRAMYLISGQEHLLIILFYHAVFALLIYGKMKFLARPQLVFLGTISYSLYLLHQYMGRKMIDTLVTYTHANSYFVIALVVLLNILLAYVVTRFVEIPANKFIRNGYKTATQEALIKTLHRFEIERNFQNHSHPQT